MNKRCDGRMFYIRLALRSLRKKGLGSKQNKKTIEYFDFKKGWGPSPQAFSFFSTLLKLFYKEQNIKRNILYDILYNLIKIKIIFEYKVGKHFNLRIGMS